MLREPSQCGARIGLRQAGMPETADRGTDGIERRRAPLDQTLDQDLVQMPQDQPFRAARGTHERVEELRTKALGTQTGCRTRARPHDEIPRTQRRLITLRPTPYIRV